MCNSKLANVNLTRLQLIIKRHKYIIKYGRIVTLLTEADQWTQIREKCIVNNLSSVCKTSPISQDALKHSTFAKKKSLYAFKPLLSSVKKTIKHGYIIPASSSATLAIS